MGAKEQMIGILRNTDTARIRFHYDSGQATVDINHGVFSRVATALANDNLHVVEGRYSENKLTYSAWADSTTGDAANTFYLGNNDRSSRDFDALVVHESIHAFFDLTRVTIPWADNEAIAYISQGYYLLNSGYPASRMEPGEPYRVGYLIAGTLRNGVDASSMIGDLRSNLIADTRYSHYINATFRGDG
jgi:hypothetical protein